MSGVTIRQGTIVAAGSIVTSSTEPYSIVGGVPAKLIRYRFERDLIDRLLKIDYKKVTKEFVCKHQALFYLHNSSEIIEQLHVFDD